MNEHGKLYGERADLYDLIYTNVDYAKLGQRLAGILKEEGVAGSARVLEAACGTGSYLRELSRHFRVSGFDLSEEMLAISRRKNPGVLHFRADMTDFSVEEPGDAIVCLFSSIGYVHGEEQVRAAMRCFAGAVVPGGTVVIEPWIRRADFRSGYASMDTYEDDDVHVARAAYSTAVEETAVVDFHWVVTRGGEGLDSFQERHELWFCPDGVQRGALDDAGFDARFEPEGLLPGRGLWIGRRR